MYGNTSRGDTAEEQGEAGDNKSAAVLGKGVSAELCRVLLKGRVTSSAKEAGETELDL